MDVLASGPERPPRVRRGLRRGRPPPRVGALRLRRRALTVASVLLTAAGVVALRAGAERAERRAPHAAGQTDELAPTPTPPYDRLPGRTPIPEPAAVSRGDLLRGPLPAVGPPGQMAARASAELVLGRYCRRPGRYAVAIDSVEGWQRVRALAIRLDRSTDPPWIVLELAWTGRSYRWTGRPVQLGTC